MNTGSSFGISLRPATLDDADILLEWRNEAMTRRASHNTAEISREEHLVWLEATLSNSKRKLFIALEESTAVGVMRVDLYESDCELSWTVAPSARGRGVGKRMVALLASRIEVPIRAEVKIDNEASKRIAEYAGMTLVKEEKGVMNYERGPLKNENY